MMIFSVGLAITIKYAYFDEISHYHTDTCHINQCIITSTECCRGQSLGRGRSCSTCFNVDVNYDLYLLNNTKNYSKVSSKTVYLSDFCNRESLNCYYDDRYILETLNPWSEYKPSDGVFIGIIFLSCFLAVITIIAVPMFITAVAMLLCCPNEFMGNESNNESNDDESNNNQSVEIFELKNDRPVEIFALDDNQLAENIESSNQSVINIESSNQSIINIKSNNDQ